MYFTVFSNKDDDDDDMLESLLDVTNLRRRIRSQISEHIFGPNGGYWLLVFLCPLRISLFSNLNFNSS